MNIPYSPIFKPIPIRTINGIEFFEIMDIIRIEANGKYPLVYTTFKAEPLKCMLSLCKLEALLPSGFFFKCHRSNVINLQLLKKFDPAERKIYLQHDHSVTISEYNIPTFIQLLLPKNKYNYFSGFKT